MKTTILSISDSDKHFAPAVDEYVKRLGSDLAFDTLKPVKGLSQQQTIQKETQKLADRLAKKYSQSYVILLTERGPSLHSISFSQLIYQKSPIVFVLGGPYGVDQDILSSYINQKLSFGEMTMPHGLIKLVLVEQIYRAQCIQRGKTYHY